MLILVDDVDDDVDVDVDVNVNVDDDSDEFQNFDFVEMKIILFFVFVGNECAPVLVMNFAKDRKLNPAARLRLARNNFARFGHWR